MDHWFFIQEALREAQKSLAQGGLPIGAILVHQQQIIGRGHNQRVQKKSPILHAEMDALENAGRLSAKIYQECVMYTTLSPCDMCTGAILLYKIPQVIIGENQNFRGAEDLLQQKGVHVTVLQHPDCIDIMQNYIKQYPKLWHEDIGI